MAKYTISARNNTSLLTTDPLQVDDFERLTAIRRFNDVGTWTLTLRRESPHAQAFLPDSNLALPNGIMIFRDNEDGTGPQLFLAGPQRGVQSTLGADNKRVLVVSGACDNYWMSKRLALPVTSYPYVTKVIEGLGTPIRYYQLAEASGTVATDNGSQAQNGTYNGTVTYSQPGLIDDPSTCIKFDGSTTFVSIPTTSLPAGNSSWSVEGWGMMTAIPSGEADMWSFGTNLNLQGAHMGIQGVGGFPTFGIFGQAMITGSTAIALNVPFFMAMTWDGTTFTCYFYQSGYTGNNVIGTQTPGALSVTYGTANIGKLIGASTFFWPGFLGHCAFYNGNIGALKDPTGNIILPLWHWQVGMSKFAYSEFFKQQATLTSLNLYNYITGNLGPAAGTFQVRWIPGITAPAVYSQAGGSETATWLARFDKVLELCQAISLASTPELGFQLQQVGNQLVFSIYIPTDRTGTAIFSLDNGNLLDYSWSYQAADANYLYAGGRNISTSLAARTFGEGSDAQSIARFGRLEDFVDYRRTTDTASMTSIINAKLAELRQKININATAQDTPGLYYGGPGNNGYNLGDKVTVQVDGQTFNTGIVREVQLDLQLGKPAILTPVIGSPADATIISEYDMLIKRIKDLETAMANLNTIF